MTASNRASNAKTRNSQPAPVLKQIYPAGQQTGNGTRGVNLGRVTKQTEAISSLERARDFLSDLKTDSSQDPQVAYLKVDTKVSAVKEKVSSGSEGSQH